jgi:hypothetical protein
VSNGTGAGVTIKTSAGTGVTVPNGATQIVYCNGTDFALAASQTNVLAGTGINVSTTGINSTVSVNTAVTATLTDAQTLTNKTLISPALTSPTLGTPVSGTLTSCVGLPIDGGTTGTLPVARGGTASTTAADARTALDVPSRGGSGASGTWGINITGNAGTVTNGVYNNGGTYSINVTGSSGTASYITNASYNGFGIRTVSTGGPSGGSNGDIWYQV